MKIAHYTAGSAKGKWVTAREFAAHFGLHVQTLANWRSQDRKAGRNGAAPGKPIYRYFGGTLRYWLPADPPEGEAA